MDINIHRCGVIQFQFNFKISDHHNYQQMNNDWVIQLSGGNTGQNSV